MPGKLQCLAAYLPTSSQECSHSFFFFYITYSCVEASCVINVSIYEGEGIIRFGQLFVIFKFSVL